MDARISTNSFVDGLAELGFRMEDVIGQERDAALGNGGLGRLAACFLDSLASLDYPAWGYGLRYRYGIFKQEIINGYQVEVPDYWLDFNPWEFPRHDVTVDIQFYGNVRKYTDDDGKSVSVWENGEIVTATAYDVPSKWPRESPWYAQAKQPQFRATTQRPRTTSDSGLVRPPAESLTSKNSTLVNMRGLCMTR